MYQNTMKGSEIMENLLETIYRCNRDEVIRMFGNKLYEQNPHLGSHMFIENSGVVEGSSDLIITFNSQKTILAVTDRLYKKGLSEVQWKLGKKEHKKIYKKLIKATPEGHSIFYSEDVDLVEMVYCSKEWYECVNFIAYQEM